MNLYAYVLNDPVNLTDPSGLRVCLAGEPGEDCDETVVTGDPIDPGLLPSYIPYGELGDGGGLGGPAGPPERDADTDCNPKPYRSSYRDAREANCQQPI